jgi:hypothetical protein
MHDAWSPVLGGARESWEFARGAAAVASRIFCSPPLNSIVLFFSFRQMGPRGSFVGPATRLTSSGVPSSSFFCPKWRKSSRARVDGRAGHRARACGAASRRIWAVLSGGGGSAAVRHDYSVPSHRDWTCRVRNETRERQRKPSRRGQDAASPP